MTSRRQRIEEAFKKVDREGLSKLSYNDNIPEDYYFEEKIDLLKESDEYENFASLGQAVLEVSEFLADKIIENGPEHRHDHLELK